MSCGTSHNVQRHTNAKRICCCEHSPGKTLECLLLGYLLIFCEFSNTFSESVPSAKCWDAVDADVSDPDGSKVMHDPDTIWTWQVLMLEMASEGDAWIQNQECHIATPKQNRTLSLTRPGLKRLSLIFCESEKVGPSTPVHLFVPTVNALAAAHTVWHSASTAGELRELAARESWQFGRRAFFRRLATLHEALFHFGMK